MACRPPHDTFPFCDVSKPIPERVADLLSRVSLKQKADWLQNGNNDVHELGLPSWEWGAEALHGLQGNCITQGDETRCPTFFPAGPALGSTFNRSLLHAIGVQIGDEVRAMGNLNVARAYGGGAFGAGPRRAAGARVAIGASP